jgi:hypothetical protein
MYGEFICTELSWIVRKLCRDCKKVLDYLAISEVIETMEDLVQFVKDLRNKDDFRLPIDCLSAYNSARILSRHNLGLNIGKT